MTRVAWLSVETPDQGGGGGQRRQYFQIKAMVEAGVDVTVGSLAGRQDDRSIRRVAPVFRYRTHILRGRRTSNQLTRFLATGGFDRAVVAHTESFPAVGSTLMRLGIPWLIDFHNVHSRWHRSRGEPAECRAWQEREKLALEAASAAVATSNEEGQALLALSSKTPVRVAGNGIAPDEWPASALAAERSKAVAMFASWNHLPNRSAAVWFVEKCWWRVLDAAPEATLELSGMGEPPEAVLRAPRVNFRGRVDPLATHLGKLRVVVLPMVEGVGARVKFGEGLASGAAVVSTFLGAEGYPPASPCVRTDDPIAFADACASLVNDPLTAAQLGAEGRAYVLGELPWARTSRAILDWARGGPVAQALTD